MKKNNTKPKKGKSIFWNRHWASYQFESPFFREQKHPLHVIGSASSLKECVISTVKVHKQWEVKCEEILIFIDYVDGKYSIYTNKEEEAFFFMDYQKEGGIDKALRVTEAIKQALLFIKEEMKK